MNGFFDDWNLEPLGVPGKLLAKTAREDEVGEYTRWAEYGWFTVFIKRPGEV